MEGFLIQGREETPGKQCHIEADGLEELSKKGWGENIPGEGPWRQRVKLES